MLTILLLSLILVIFSIGINLIPYSVVYVLVSIIATVVLVLWAHYTQGLGLNEIGLTKKSIKSGVIWGLIIGLAIVALIILIFTLIPDNAFEPKDATAHGLIDLIYRLFIRTPFGVVLLEETAFRGVLLYLLKSKNIGSFAAVLISSAVFGLWHIGVGVRGVPLPDLLTLSAVGSVLIAVGIGFAGGLVFGWLRVGTKGLWGPMIAHYVEDAGKILYFTLR